MLNLLKRRAGSSRGSGDGAMETREEASRRAWETVTLGMERALVALPLLGLRALSRPEIRARVVPLVLVLRPVTRGLAGAVGAWLRSRTPPPPEDLAFLRSLWLALGRYCGWVS